MKSLRRRWQRQPVVRSRVLTRDQSPMNAGDQHSLVDVGQGHHTMRISPEAAGVHKRLKTTTFRTLQLKIHLTGRTMRIADTGEQCAGVHDQHVGPVRRRAPEERRHLWITTVSRRHSQRGRCPQRGHEPVRAGYLIRRTAESCGFTTQPDDVGGLMSAPWTLVRGISAQQGPRARQNRSTWADSNAARQPSRPAPGCRPPRSEASTATDATSHSARAAPLPGAVGPPTPNQPAHRP